MRPSWLMAAALVLLTVPSVPAQNYELLQMAVEADTDFIVMELGGSSSVFVTVRDESRDGTAVVPDSPQNQGLPHSLSVKAEVLGDQPRGWSVLDPASTSSRSGQENRFEVIFLNTPAAENPFFSVRINVTMEGQGGQEINQYLLVTAYTPGRDGFNAQVARSFQVAPQGIESIPVKVTNIGLYPRTFDLEVADNPCNVLVSPPSSIVVGGKATEEVFVTVQGPTDKFLYLTEACSITMRLVPQDNPNIDQTVILGGQVNGAYFNPIWGFWATGILLAVILLALVVADRKARIEEEILGKPQKPWTIPVERVYLDHLKERDPRAHYVVRHFLMEEEYQSALLWYKEFKKGTAGARSKERLVVAQEHKVDRFEARWKKRIAAPVKASDRFEARLQKKLDRKGKGALRKQHRKWRKTTKKMQAAHEAKVQKATQKWEKAAARAQKKDKPVPEKPVFPEPDYPPEPSQDRLLLADHRWNKKAERRRRKAVKKQGNLEVKFERKEARLLRKVRRKVEKIARKLDDPDFAAEHPLLGGKAAASAVRKEQAE